MPVVLDTSRVCCALPRFQQYRGRVRYGSTAFQSRNVAPPVVSLSIHHPFSGLAWRSDLNPSRLVACKQLFDRCDLVLHSLRLVRPASNTDIALNAHNAIFVQKGVSLSDETHDIVPGSFCCNQTMLLVLGYVDSTWRAFPPLQAGDDQSLECFRARRLLLTKLNMKKVCRWLEIELIALTNCRACRVHTVLQSTLLHQTLDLRNFRRYRSCRGADRNEAEVCRALGRRFKICELRRHDGKTTRLLRRW